jgi:hypothetical protein
VAMVDVQPTEAAATAPEQLTVVVRLRTEAQPHMAEQQLMAVMMGHVPPTEA